VRAVLINRADAVAPQISHTAPASWEAHLPLEVAAEITDDVVVAASVFWRVSGGSYDEIAMERAGATSWSAVIPGSEITTAGLEYYIRATDGTQAAELPGASSPFVVTVTADLAPPAMTGLQATPSTFSPNGDGYKDVTAVTATLSEPAYVWLAVEDSLGALVRELADSVLAEASAGAVWDGKDQGGTAVPDGNYTVVGDCLDLAGRRGTQRTAPVTVDRDQPARRLDVVLLFHANQNLVPYGRAANRACYKGVLQTLRAHPTLKFVIHFSGTLLSDLLWWDPETIEILRAGAADGQFEIVGSTYAQNIMYSTRSAPDDFEFNQHQIAIHRDLIESALGATPVSFWNPERVWTENFVRLLADNGYANVQVEDHILLASGITGSEYLVRTTTYDGRTVNVFDDDKTFEGMVNGAIDSGDTSSVMSFLRWLYSEDLGDQYAVCYHEDMEATGLWDYEGGENPQVDFSNLGKLLTAFERDSRIKVTTYSEFLQSHDTVEDVSPIVDGAADWMGRDSWFDENAAAQAEGYRVFFDAIRDTINAIHATLPAHAPDTLVARNLIDHAWFTLVAHQYEFAVHGYGGIAGTTQWELARTALVAARAARYALAGVAEPPRTEDINGDTIEEIVLATATDLFVFSPYGGKLLYWFDLEDGAELVGNENFMRNYGETYTNDNAYVPVAEGCEGYSWLCGNNIYPEIHQWDYEARRRCFNDSMWVEGEVQPDLVNRLLAYTLEGSAVEFQYDLGELTVAKRFVPAEHSLSVEYVFSSESSQALTADLLVENGLSPDCLEVMLTGRAALTYWDGEDTSSVFTAGMRGVANVVSGRGLLLDFETAPALVSGEEDVFGLEVNPRWQLEIPPLGSGSVSLRLGLQSVSGVKPPDGKTFHGLLLIRPNPSRGSVDLYLRSPVTAPVWAEVYDARGRHVRTVPGRAGAAAAAGAAGANDATGAVSWDGLDGDGRPVASGVYTVKVISGDVTSTGKVTLVR
ncbi:MAG: FlgD immunoglobulin-like domain containing protein, partial [bacterium]